MGIISFLIGLAISTVLIYIVTKLLGEKEGIKTALLAALLGSIMFGIVSFIFGNGIIAAAIGGIIWLVSLKWLYSTGWLKAILIAVVLWIVVSFVGLFLPTFPSPF
ncbi:MAG TPA: hypothetical protein VD815_10905 [Candidatus Saccharimonadales bacterium]|nr:hypothetical protein [Candidatus Saccharimonadales bacterium]